MGRNARQLDSSDEDESTLNSTIEGEGHERRTENFEERSESFKRNCKGFATIIVLLIFLMIVFVPSLMGASQDLSVVCLDDKLQNAF